MKLNQNGLLIVLSGPSGVGKGTVRKALFETEGHNFTYSISMTTRNPREGEQDGVDYYFVSKDEFETKIRQGDFYEYDLHHGNYYGTSRELMNAKIAQGKVIVKDIEVNGTESLIKLLGNDTRIVTIFLKVEKEELKRRFDANANNELKPSVEVAQKSWWEKLIGLGEWS